MITASLCVSDVYTQQPHSSLCLSFAVLGLLSNVTPLLTVSCHRVMIRIMISMITRMLEAAHHMNNGQDTTAAEDRGWAQVTAAAAGQLADSSCHQLSQLQSQATSVTIRIAFFFSNNNTQIHTSSVFIPVRT